jgi:protein-tyrosine phosphatase
MAYTDFNWIDDRLAIGAIVSEPEELPFDAILSMETHAPATVAEIVRSGRVDYQWRSIVDGYSWEANDEIVRRFDAAAKQIRSWLESGKRVLVHCTAGVSRSVSAVAWYLMRYEGYSWDEALELIRQGRSVAYPNIRFEIPLRLAAGEDLSQEEIEARIDAFVTEMRERYGSEVPPEDIWDDLVRQGTLAASY